MTPLKTRKIKLDPNRKQNVKVSPLQAKLLLRLVTGKTFGWIPAETEQLAEVVAELAVLASRAPEASR